MQIEQVMSAKPVLAMASAHPASCVCLLLQAWTALFSHLSPFQFFPWPLVREQPCIPFPQAVFLRPGRELAMNTSCTVPGLPSVSIHKSQRTPRS